MPNKIWHANNLNGTQWFIAGSDLSQQLDWVPELIPAPGTPAFLNLPEAIKKILRLDNPDLIVTLEMNGTDVPAISIEVTTTTPQSQHAKQRFPRLVAAAEEDVPAIYIIPGRKRSGPSRYRLGSDLYRGADRVQDINGVPVLVYQWPDDDGHLLYDPNYPQEPSLAHGEIPTAFGAIDRIILHKLQSRNANDFRRLLAADPWIQAEIARHQEVASSGRVAVDNYKTLTRFPTANLESYLQSKTAMTRAHIAATIEQLPARIRGRPETLVFHPGGRMFQHAGDPYVGMLSFFDYVFCRTDRRVEDRHTNLVYMPTSAQINHINDEFSTAGYHAFWANSCPFRTNQIPTVGQQFSISHHLQYGCEFTKIKPLRIYSYFSDMIVFQDAMLVF